MLYTTLKFACFSANRVPNYMYSVLSFRLQTRKEVSQVLVIRNLALSGMRPMNFTILRVSARCVRGLTQGTRCWLRERPHRQDNKLLIIIFGILKTAQLRALRITLLMTCAASGDRQECVSCNGGSHAHFQEKTLVHPAGIGDRVIDMVEAALRYLYRVVNTAICRRVGQCLNDCLVPWVREERTVTGMW